MDQKKKKRKNSSGVNKKKFRKWKPSRRRSKKQNEALDRLRERWNLTCMKMGVDLKSSNRFSNRHLDIFRRHKNDKRPEHCFLEGNVSLTDLQRSHQHAQQIENFRASSGSKKKFNYHDHINKAVYLTLINGEAVSGRVHTVDPETTTYMLLSSKQSKTSLEIIPGYAIKSVECINDDEMPAINEEIVMKLTRGVE